MPGIGIGIVISVMAVMAVTVVVALALSSRRIIVRITGAVSQQGIRPTLDAVAIVTVGGTDDSVRAAPQRFLHQQDEVESFTQEVLAGSLRSIVGTLTVDEIIRDRAASAAQVAEESISSLSNQGLVLNTFQINGRPMPSRSSSGRGGDQAPVHQDARD